MVELGQLALGETRLDVVMSGAVAQVTQTLGAEYASVLEFVDGRERLAVGAGAGWRAGTVGGVIIGTAN